MTIDKALAFAVPIAAKPSGWRHACTALPAAIAVLGLFYALMITSIADKSVTYDEIVHVTAGYSYWQYSDYRLNPENGNLPQRLVALPLLGGDFKFPPLDQPAWRQTDEWSMGHQFLHIMGNDLDAMLLRGRMAAGLLAVALGLVVYLWARKLFGPTGGMLALLLFVLNPTVLANGALMTSDMAGALFFLLSVWALWTLMHRITPWTVLAAGLAVGGLCVSKMSAPLILPMAVGMLFFRCIASPPLELCLRARHRSLDQLLYQVATIAGAALVVAAIAIGIIWLFYGLRFDMMNNPQAGVDRLRFPWPQIQANGTVGACMQFARDQQLLPEAYLYGQAFVLKFAGSRPAFLNGQYSLLGWTTFFPYTFLVKTPLTLFAVVVLAMAAAIRKWRLSARIGQTNISDLAAESFYRTAPLWVLMLGYWFVATNSNLNIGHRHILPVYAPMLILAAGAVYWLQRKRRVLAGTLILCVALLAVETLCRWPNYLAYFNQVAGGPSQGYKHLVDSSLDWGQDLPALKRYLDGRGLNRDGAQPVYLAYFGTGYPKYYGIRSKPLPVMAGWERLENPAFFPLTGGVYCISATALQPVLGAVGGPWTKQSEAKYCQALAKFKELSTQPASADAADAQQRAELIDWFDWIRFARLCAYLRQRPCDDQVNYTILVYNLTDAQVRQALDGPGPYE